MTHFQHWNSSVDDSPTLTDDTAETFQWARSSRASVAFVVAWCRSEANRESEVMVVPVAPKGGWALFGRGPARADDAYPRLTLNRFRGSKAEVVPALSTPTISRVQLMVRLVGADGIEVRNVGRCSLLHNGNEVSAALIHPGDTLQVGNELLLLCIRRPPLAPSPGGVTNDDSFPFGEADADGIVGESPAIFLLREQIAFVAPRTEHVLILGASGTGKELVARALHRRSSRGGRALVSRNAATFPEGLVAAELYGNAKNFPNPGMLDRIGLIGQADGTTLFLDEFAELPAPMQAQLLRVLDEGEYQRLGETHTRRSDFRLLAATNRPIEALRPDIAARFTFRIEVPDLNARKEDIALLVRHLVRAIAEHDPDAATRVFRDGPMGLQAIPCVFMRNVLEHDYVTNVRELNVRLWEALVSKATGSSLMDGFNRATTIESTAPRLPQRSSPPPESHLNAGFRESGAPEPPPSEDPKYPTPAHIQACLDKHNGVQELAWRELGLSNRHALARLIAKHGLEVRRRPRRDARPSHRDRRTT